MAKTPTTSPSTPAPPSTGRQLVRARSRPLTAYQVSQTTHVELPGSAPITAHEGWWVISDGPKALAVVPPAHFVAQYEPVNQTALALTPEQCTAIEAIAGPGTCRDAGTLLAAVNRLGTLALGGVNLSFTPGQLEELKHRAEKRDRSIEDELQLVVDRIRDELFHRGPNT